MLMKLTSGVSILQIFYEQILRKFTQFSQKYKSKLYN